MQYFSNLSDLCEMRQGLFDSSSVRPFRDNQSFEKIVRECRATGVKFTDDFFPPDDSSIFFRKNPVPRGYKIEWARISDVEPNARIFVDRADPRDVIQGQIGNFWFIAALSIMSTKKGLLTRVVPDFLDDKNEVGLECGVYRFRFWSLGQWIEVVIDDYLPFFNRSLIFVNSREKTEFWGPLIEKAYAKLSGNYENIVNGQTEDALLDFTGGITEHYELKDLSKSGSATDARKASSREMFDVCLEAMQHPVMLSCLIEVADPNLRETKNSMSLILGHAYAITAVAVTQNGDKLLQIYNPSGTVEWQGPWSDGAPEWDTVAEEDRKKLHVKAEDGMFWMSWNDFVKHFTWLNITRLVSTSVFSNAPRWHASYKFGSWDPVLKTAGGCMNYRDSFLSNNRQYSIFVPRDQSIVIGLIQEDRRSLNDDEQVLSIGYYIFKTERNRSIRLSEIPHLTGKSIFANVREAVARFDLKRGRYFIVPCTFKPEKQANYLLRIYSESECEVEQIIRWRPIPRWPCIAGPRGQLCIRILEAMPDVVVPEGAVFYCSLECEGLKERTFDWPAVKGSTCILEEEFILMLKLATNPLHVGLWIQKGLKTERVGSIMILIQGFVARPNSTVRHKHQFHATNPAVSTGSITLEISYKDGFSTPFTRSQSKFELTSRKLQT